MSGESKAGAGVGGAGAASAGTGTGAGVGAGTGGLVPFPASPLQLLNQAGFDLSVGMPFAQPIRLIDRARIAGTTHVPGIEELAAGLLPGDRLPLRREPDNAYDHRAIVVTTPQGDKLGYLSVDVNDIPSRLMDAGKELYAQVLSVSHRGSYTFIEVEVYLHD